MRLGSSPVTVYSLAGYSKTAGVITQAIILIGLAPILMTAAGGLQVQE
jgi:hypothetical protein